MACKPCQHFLYDFLQVGLHTELPLTKKIRIESLQKILPEFTDWMHSICKRITPEDYTKATTISSKIARRDRSLHEYEYIQHTATYNFLKYQIEWLCSEVDYMKLLLVDSGVIRGKEPHSTLKHAQDYISYMLPRSIACIHKIHDSHLHPKGIYTDTNTQFL